MLIQSRILSIVNEMTTLCVSVKAGNEVILGTVGGSSRPIIVSGTWGRPTFFSEQGPI